MVRGIQVSQMHIMGRATRLKFPFPKHYCVIFFLCSIKSIFQTGFQWYRRYQLEPQQADTSTNTTKLGSSCSYQNQYYRRMQGSYKQIQTMDVVCTYVSSGVYSKRICHQFNMIVCVIGPTICYFNNQQRISTDIADRVPSDSI